MESIFLNYLKHHNYTHFDLKAILFDMDGILYDSMPAHIQSWQQTMEEYGYKSTHAEEFYLHEGRVGKSTINIITEREFGRPASEEEKRDIYARKTKLFLEYNKGEIILGSKELLQFVKSQELKCILVTGSGQPSLLNKLDNNFPGIFTPLNTVTAFDVENGKPHPEPFIMGLEKAGALKPYQAITIENAPLGIESSVNAGVFTIAVNTGPLDDSLLKEKGANIVLSSMLELLDKLPEILKITSSIRNN